MAQHLWFDHAIEEVIASLKHDLNYCYIHTDDYKYDEMLKALNKFETFYYNGDQYRINYLSELQRKYDALKIIAHRYTNDHMFKEFIEKLDKVKSLDGYSIISDYKECADQLAHCNLCNNKNKTTFMNYIVETNCKHTFHLKCFNDDYYARWVAGADTCPYCKKSYYELRNRN